MNDPTPLADPPANAYDQIPYTSFPYPRSHPDHLRSVAGLFGLDAAPVTACRVLEIGCASGGNLIPMAEQLPGSTFVGIDLSARQIETGQTAVDAIGIDNLQLRCADLVAVDESLGEFDYIVCHGVYSWVAPDVQEAILRLCRRHLRERGVAFISYNTYPGFYLRQAVRDMMRFHVAQFDDPQTRVAQARALVEFFAAAAPGDGGDPYRTLLQRELEILRRTGSDYLFHEHLEEHNQPCYFHEFVARLQAAQLQYLGEADTHTMLTRDLPGEVSETLARISPDIVRLEQYTDFVRNRQMRCTLVCHAEVVLERSLAGRVVFDRGLGFAGRPVDGPVDLASGTKVTFAVGGGATVSSSRPTTKAALVVLTQHAPDVLSFDELWAQTSALLARGNIVIVDETRDREELAADLLECFFRGGVQLRTWRPTFTRTVGVRPRVSAYARWQATHARFATSRRHDRVDLDEASAQVVRLLDGQRDRAAIVEGLLARVDDGTLRLSRDDQAIEDRDAMREALGMVVDETLQRLAEHALLLA
jgi:methyltransferase-like protein/ubiquinone/menaquinone biosynthesis C-methylase UbiE